MKFIKKYKTLLGLVTVIVVSIFAIFPFFHPGFFPMHDDTQVARVYEMGKALRDGMFPVRWVQDLGYGYGYPIFNFYAPLAYYIGGFLVLLGLNALLATKIMMVIGIVFAGISMYFLATELFGVYGGIISGVLYEYAIYHAVDIYVRGDVGEFFAYAMMPLVFLGIYKIYQKLNYEGIQNLKLQLKIVKIILPWTLLGSVAYAGVILSHNLTAMMVTPVLLLFIIILVIASHKEKRFIVLHQMLHIIFFGILLSAFYWLPALFEAHYTNVLSQIGGGANFHNHFICVSQLWYSPWGYGGSTGGCTDGLSFMLGKITIILGGLGILGFLWKKQKRIVGIIIGFGLLLSLFLTTEFSKAVWEFIKPMAFFQYPWRFLLLASFFLALLGSGIVFLSQRIKNGKYTVFITTLSIIGILFFQQKYFVPQKINPVSSDFYTNNVMLRFTTSKISDEYMPIDFKKPAKPSDLPKNPTTLLDSVGKVAVLQNSTQEKTFRTMLIESSKLLIAQAPFPAWHAFVDGKEEQTMNLSQGILIHVPKGDHFVSVVFLQTPIEIFGDFLSFAGLLIVILGIIYGYTEYVFKKTNS